MDATHYASIYPSHHDANLVLVRQQRDLFSGGLSPTHLGIPDVTTHVGSVIHAFETLAQQRQMKEAEKPYESSKSTSSSNKKESIHKIILPPPPPNKRISTGTHTMEPTTAKHIVRHRPKGKAPDIPTSSTNTASATTQTTVFSGDENESSALDSLNLEDVEKTASAKFPQSYVVKNYKVLPPFVPPHQPSRIPTKAMNKQNNQAARNRLSDSLLPSKSRTDVFLPKSTKHTTEDDIENDFLRGTTVSQSFIKNVVRKSPTRKISTYEQNFLMNSDDPQVHVSRSKRRSLDSRTRDMRSRSGGSSKKIEQPLIDEVSRRYREYSGDSSKQYNFSPRSIDRAEL